MPPGMHPFESVLDLTMPPPPPRSRLETGDTPLPWGSPTPGYTPAPSHSQSTPRNSSHNYRRLAPHELSIVQLAIQYVGLRQPHNLKPFHDAILQGFDEAHHWRYKSIPRKLLDLEGY